MVAASKKEIHLLDCEIIAKILLSEPSSINVTLGFDTTTNEMVKKFLQQHSEDLRKMLFQPNKYEQLMQYIGITLGEQDKPADDVKPKDKA